MTSIKGYEHISPELLVRLATVAPDLWAKHPELALSFAFGPPIGTAVPQLASDQELLAVSEAPELERLFEVGLAISDERREKMKRMRQAAVAKDRVTVLQIAHELVGVPYEKEEGHRTHSRIN